MSAHVQDKLWAHARGQLSAADANAVTTHVAECGDCARILEQFKAAVSVVTPVEPPALDDAAWRRIDSKVLEAARKELVRPRSPFEWLSEHWRAFALVGALGAATAAIFLVVTKPEINPAPQQSPIAQAPTVIPAPVPVLPAVIQEPPSAVQVASAAKLTVDEAAVEQGGQVRVGQKLRTGVGGQAFVVLPEGSKAGVLANSTLTLAQASAKEVRLELDRGTLLVAAAHAGEERKFQVVAGQVEVFVVGTRFLVERDDRTTVVVDEGQVEVLAGGQKHVVVAGETFVVESNGKVIRKKSITPASRAAFRTLTGEPEKLGALTKPNTEPKLTDTEPSEQIQEPEVVAQPDAGAKVAFADPTPPPLVVPGDTAPTQQQQKPQDRFDFLSALKKIDLKNVNLDSPFPPPGMPVAEYRVHQLRLAADRGQCERVVERSDAWLGEFGADNTVKDLPTLKKTVLFTKARCLSKLGKNADAEKVRAQADAIH